MSACPSCVAELPAGARFCPACGVAQGAPAPVGERRVVTVVFADLAGFTTMAEGRDPEAVKELLDTCFGALVPVIVEHGGIVDKIIGDELMAVFGAPRAHEDDPERAVRAGLALLASLERLDPSLEMRIGINTGEVLAGPVGPGGAYTVTGDTVNTAHRLVGVAPQGAVLVAERTHVATRRAVEYGPAEAHVLRGRHEPVVAHRALGVRHGPGEPTDGGTLTPMVGRHAELSLLVDTIRAARGSWSPRLVTVVGEAGIGKTRLLGEVGGALTEAGCAATVLTVHCAPYGDAGPLAPLASAVRVLLGVDGHRPRDDQVSLVADRVGDLASRVGVDRGYLVERVQQLLGLLTLPATVPIESAPGRGRVSDELVVAARLVLDDATRDGPVVVVLDDAHFADDLVLDLTERVAVWGAGHPLVLVVVGREELTDQRPSLTTPTRPEQVVLRLDPLDEEASQELLHRTLREVDRQDGELSAGVVAEVLRAAGGNPLLLDQLARYLRETGALVPAEGGWRATRDLTDAGIPDDARALLGARLDALPARERALLQGAAIVGRAFDDARVRALGVAVDDDLLIHLWHRGLVAVGPLDGELAFRHAMVRDAAYASVPIGDRAAKHERLARWLVDQDAEANLGQVAHHFERAVTLSGELGHTDAALIAAAGLHLVAAAQLAFDRDETREAERWLERARALGLVPDADAVTVTLLHASALVALRRLPDAKAAYLEVTAATLDAAATGEACTGLGVVARLQGEADDARAWFDAGRRAWQAAGDLRGEAASIRTHGWSELVAGRPRAALPKLLRARDLEESVGASSGVTLQCLAWCEFLVGDHAAARAHLWDAARELSEVNDRLALGWCFAILGNSLWQEGRVGQARQIAENLLRAAGNQGDPYGEGMCLVLLAGCLLEGGDLEPARATATQAVRAFGAIEDPWGDANARLVQGMVERVAGDLAAARSALERGLETARRVASVGTEARLRAELAATLLDLGDEEGAAREARATLALVRSGGGDRDSEIRALVILAKRARLLDDDPDGGLLLEEAIGLAVGAVPTSIWRRAVAFSAIQAADDGQVERAAALAAEALEGSWESARTWVLAQRATAAAQVVGGDLTGARRTLDAVLERFQGRPLAFVEPARDDHVAVQQALATTVAGGVGDARIVPPRN